MQQRKFLLLLAAALITTPSYAMPRHVDVELKAGAVHEDCLRLQPQQRVRYKFATDLPIEFNLHYHAQRDVVYPLKSESVTEQQGDYIATTGQEYCLMWSSRASGATKLGYEFFVVEPGLTKQ